MAKTTATADHVSYSHVPAIDPVLKNRVGTGKGRILRVKRGYNPNSSSLGSDIFAVFAVPGAFFAMTAGFGAISGIILSAFLKPEEAQNDSAQHTIVSANTDEREGSLCSEKESNV